MDQSIFVLGIVVIVIHSGNWACDNSLDWWNDGEDGGEVAGWCVDSE